MVPSSSPVHIATICIVYRNNRQEIVWLRRGQGEFMGGQHVPPGGKFEAGERGEECVAREINEEINHSLENVTLKGIVRFDNRERDFGEGIVKPDWMVWVYTANSSSPERVDGGSTHWQWVNRADFSKLNIQPGDDILFDWVENREGIFSGIIQYKGKAVACYKATFYLSDGKSYDLEGPSR